MIMQFYKNEKESWGEFLGTGRTATFLKAYRSYQELKKYAQSLKIKSQKEWSLFTKSKQFPKDIPLRPDFSSSYKNKWEGWGKFLGTGNVAVYLRKYRTYELAKKYAQSLKLKNINEWNKHTKSKKFPKDVPVSVEGKVYEDKWEGWGKFLGTGTIAPQFRKYRSYKEAKKYTQPLKLKNVIEWRKYTKSKNFPRDIPLDPYHLYKNKKEWKGWPDFLGTSTKPRRKKS